MDRGNNRSLICTWRGGGGATSHTWCVCVCRTWAKSDFWAGFITFDHFGEGCNAIVLVIVLLIAQRSGLKTQFPLHWRWLLKQLEDILKSEEKLEYLLPHENSQNPLILLHCCIAVLRSNCRSIGKNITRYKKGSFSSLLRFFLLTDIKIWSAHFHFIDLKSLFVTTLTKVLKFALLMSENGTPVRLFLVEWKYYIPLMKFMTSKCNLKPQRPVTQLPMFGGKRKCKSLKRDKSTSRNLNARLAASRLKEARSARQEVNL